MTTNVVLDVDGYPVAYGDKLESYVPDDGSNVELKRGIPEPPSFSHTWDDAASEWVQA